MELRQLRQVVILAETLNFHRAAERLNMAQPPLSTSIRKLEDELGVQLFERRPSGLVITTTGETLLQFARQALFAAEELQRAAHACAKGERGRLTVGFVGSATHSLLPRLIPLFRQRYPDVDLVLQESTTVEMIGLISRRQLDVALVRTPVLDPAEASVTLLESDGWVLAVRSDSPLADRESIDLASLGDASFIVYSQSKVPAMHLVTMLAFREAGIAPRIAQQAIQVHTMFSLVESGLGIAMMPAISRPATEMAIRLIPLTGLSAALSIGIAIAHHRVPGATAKRFIDLAHESLARASDTTPSLTPSPS